LLERTTETLYNEVLITGTHPDHPNQRVEIQGVFLKVLPSGEYIADPETVRTLKQLATQHSLPVVEIPEPFIPYKASGKAEAFINDTSDIATGRRDGKRYAAALNKGQERYLVVKEVGEYGQRTRKMVLSYSGISSRPMTDDEYQKFLEEIKLQLPSNPKLREVFTKLTGIEVSGEPSADSRPEASDSRSELSQASPGTVETLASMLRPGRKADLSRSEVRAIYEVTLRGDQDALVETLKRIAEKQIAEASMSAGTARVTREMAVATIDMIIEALKAAGVKGNLTMIFDVSPDKNFMEALQAVKDEIGTAVFTKGAVRNLDRKALEGVTVQTVGSLKSYKPLAAENAEAVPVLSQNLGSDYFANEVLFGVGLDAGDVQGEPFLEVTENVLRMAVGLLKADLMTRGMDPEEINAKLMEILFKLDTDSGRGVLSVNGRHLVVHREALQQMMVEYQATAEIQRAA